MSCDTTKPSVRDNNIYAPHGGLGTLAKELTFATRLIKSCSKELSSPVSVCVNGSKVSRAF